MTFSQPWAASSPAAEKAAARWRALDAGQIPLPAAMPVSVSVNCLTRRSCSARSTLTSGRCDQLAQRSVECLFRYAEDAEQGIDRCFRVAPDKIQYPVMYPTQPALRQQLIRLRGKSTVGEEELLGGVAQSIDVI